MSWYKTGTVTVTNGSAAVTGAGTSWVDNGTLNAGDIIKLPDGLLYEVLTIGSNTGLTLASNYLGSNASGGAYAIMPIGLLPSTLAQQVKSVLATANTALISMVRFDTNSQGLTTTEQQNARLNINALTAADVGYGYLTKSVAGGADITLSAAEAANEILNFTGTLTANINVIVPAAARTWTVRNATSGAYTLTLKTPSGTGIAVTQGTITQACCDATNVVAGISSVAGGMVFAGALSGITTLGATGTATLASTKTASGNTGSILNNTATTMFSASGSGGLYLVHAYLVAGAGTPSSYAAAALVRWDGTAAAVSAAYDTDSMFFTTSGAEVKIRQMSGATQASGVNWVYQRIGS